MKYWHSVRDDVEPASYVMDVCKLSTGEWRLIELNPFADTTGGCLYTWGGHGALLRGDEAAAMARRALPPVRFSSDSSPVFPRAYL